jgi:hypothetical protein
MGCEKVQLLLKQLLGMLPSNNWGVILNWPFYLTGGRALIGRVVLKGFCVVSSVAQVSVNGGL